MIGSIIETQVHFQTGKEILPLVPRHPCYSSGRHRRRHSSSAFFIEKCFWLGGLAKASQLQRGEMPSLLPPRRRRANPEQFLSGRIGHVPQFSLSTCGMLLGVCKSPRPVRWTVGRRSRTAFCSSLQTTFCNGLPKSNWPPFLSGTLSATEQGSSTDAERRGAPLSCRTFCYNSCRKGSIAHGVPSHFQHRH